VLLIAVLAAKWQRKVNFQETNKFDDATTRQSDNILMDWRETNSRSFGSGYLLKKEI
jgi:hypothetical protein